MFARRRKFEIQGYCGYSDKELTAYAPGIRFAYQISTATVAVGLILTSIPILVTVMASAFLGLVLPRHPFDYLYNSTVRYWLKKPAMPRRSPQSKFAFLIGSLWLAMIIFLFSKILFPFGYIAGVILLVGGLSATIDFCIPSIIYNFILKISLPSKSGNK